MSEWLLDIRGLNVSFPTLDGESKPVNDVTFKLRNGGIHGLIGESGSGKSVLAAAILGLLPERARVSVDFFQWESRSMLNADGQIAVNDIRQQAALIFQDPIQSLDPLIPVGEQLLEHIRARCPKASKHFLRERRAALLHDVGLPHDESILGAYPRQLTAGTAQRICIANAIATEPRLLIADEATTNLDMLLERQMLSLLQSIHRKFGTTMLIITHDFGLLKKLTDVTYVMYCGHLIEEGPTEAIIHKPYHPYTRALVNSSHTSFDPRCRLQEVPVLRGTIPALSQLPLGCPLGPRCDRAGRPCSQMPAYTVEGVRTYRCHFPIEYHH